MQLALIFLVAEFLFLVLSLVMHRPCRGVFLQVLVVHPELLGVNCVGAEARCADVGDRDRHERLREERVVLGLVVDELLPFAALIFHKYLHLLCFLQIQELNINSLR